MSDELTEAERVNQLAHAIYATGALNLPLSDRIDVDCHDAARAVVESGWVSPDEAKAREERLRAKVARVEALAESMQTWSNHRGLAVDYASRIRAALATEDTP